MSVKVPIVTNNDIHDVLNPLVLNCREIHQLDVNSVITRVDTNHQLKVSLIRRPMITVLDNRTKDRRLVKYSDNG